MRRTNTSYGRALRQSDANSNIHDNGYGYSNSDSHGDGNCDCDCDCDSSAQADTYAEASWNSPTAAIVGSEEQFCRGS